MKEKILAHLDLPTFCFLALAIKIILLDSADYASALALIPVSAIYAYTRLLKFKVGIRSHTLEKQVADLQNAVASLKMGQSVRKVSNDTTKTEKRYF